MSRSQRLRVVLALNLALVAGLIVVGVLAHSVAVFAEGGDYLLDAAGVGVALLAANEVAALINAGWLLALQLLVAGAAVYRLVAGTPQVDGQAVLVVSGVAAVVMAVGALVLRGDAGDGGEVQDEEDLSVKAVLLDTVADSAAAAGVAAAGGVILATGAWYWLDPAVALVIAVVVAYHAVRLIQRVLSSAPVP